MARALEDKVIVITGASSGIGAATAIECARAGMDSVLLARRADQLEAIAAMVREQGRTAVTVVGDVLDAKTSDQLLDEAAKQFGGFHAVFANAGYGLNMPTLDTDEQMLRRIFDVNFFAAVDLLSNAAKRLIGQQETGHLLMCASCLSKFTLPGYGAYAATKAAQSHVAAAMRAELRPHRIDVSAVQPITTTSEFFETAAQLSGQQPAGAVPDHARWPFVQTPQRVARAVVKCLKRPRPEVWTSHIVRLTAAAMTASPAFADFVLRRQAHKQ